MKTLPYTVVSILILAVLVPNSIEAQSRRMVKAMPQPLPRTIDYEGMLPTKAKAVLDSAFSTWSFRTGITEYENPDSEFPSAPFQRCFINNDTIPDYAVHIVVGEDSTAIEQFVVLLAETKSYHPVTLLSRTHSAWDFGLYYSILYKAGYQFWLTPFADEGDSRSAFPTDCIGILMRDKNSCDIFVFDNGKFKSFSPCD